MDDEEGFLELCRERLGSEPTIAADYASSPSQALEMLRDREYHVVVSDHEPRGMSGLQFLRAVRSLTSVPFLLVIGHGREGLAIDALRNGADFFIEKTGRPSATIDILLRALRTLGSPERDVSECLTEPFPVFSSGSVLMISNGGERVLAAKAR